MLTRPVAAVKFDLSSTPEQAACSMNIDEGLKTFWNLVEHMQHAADRHQPIHQVEETIFRELLVIGKWLLQAFLDMAGTGDVGPTVTVASDSPSDPDQNFPGWSNHTGVPICRSSARSPLSGPATGRIGSKPPPWTRNSTCRGASIRTCSSSGWGRLWSTMLTPRRSASWRRSSAWRSP